MKKLKSLLRESKNTSSFKGVVLLDGNSILIQRATNIEDLEKNLYKYE